MLTTIWMEVSGVRQFNQLSLGDSACLLGLLGACAKLSWVFVEVLEGKLWSSHPLSASVPLRSSVTAYLAPHKCFRGVSAGLTPSWDGWHRLWILPH